MRKHRISIDEYNILVKYKGPFGRATSEKVEEWLIQNIGEEDYEWCWGGYDIALDNEIDAVAFKLKFAIH